MSSRGTGITLAVGVVAGIIGYMLWQMTIGFNTAADDLSTILQNSASGATALQVVAVLVGVGLSVHLAGLWGTRGTASGTYESLGILLITVAIISWVIGISDILATAELGKSFVAALPGASAGDPAATAMVGRILVTEGAAQASGNASGDIGGLLAGLGWISMGLAYRGSDFKGALSFLPLGWLAIVAGTLLVVSILVITSTVSREVASQVNGICFLLITLWSISVGVKLATKSD